MATLQELESALINADKAGDLDGARRLASAITKARQDTSNQIPGAIVPGTTPGYVEPSVGEKIIGAGEAALTLGTGAVGGTAGLIGGTLKGLAEQILSGQFGSQQAADLVQKSAMQGAQALTYEPRTQSGQEQVQAISEALQNVPPVIPVIGPAGAIAAGTKAAMPIVAAGARHVAAPIVQVAQRAGQVVSNVAEPIREMLPSSVIKQPTPGSIASVGAAAVPLDIVRATKAAGLPVKIDLTLGAETRNAAQLAFEKEQMKSPSLGAPLRARAEENNLQALQNFDALIDMTEAQSPDFAATGNTVVKALSEGHKAAKNKTNVAYARAKNSPEAQAAVDTNMPVSIGEGENTINNSLIGYLNEKVSGIPSAAVPDAARKILIKLGLAEEDQNGVLSGKQATVGKMEEFRKELSGTAKWDDRVGIREETIIKKLIDAQTEPVSGPLYKEARSLRQQQAMKYENRAVVARLINNRKGMDDPLVAVDQVFNRSVINGSPEEITFLKRVLNTSGADGRQAWKDLQGSMVRYLQEESQKGMGLDSADRQIVSPAKLHQAVSTLDKNGRLDIVFGKKTAEIVRDLNDVIRYVNTTPPGTLINNSGTAGTLMAAIAEAGITGSLLGLPVPVMTGLRMLSKQVKSNKIKSQINRALNIKPPQDGKF